MKRFFFFAITIALSACADDESKPIISTDLAGIWVNHEVESANGEVREVSPAESVFGVYAESIQVKGNGVYVPVIWYSVDNYDFKKDDKGELVQKGNTLILTKGSWDMKFIILRLEGDDLWIKRTDENDTSIPERGIIFKLKRESDRTSY
jgi:hypothetical protein